MLRVHQSGYYHWLASRDSDSRERGNRVLKAQIRAVFKEFKGRYGSPRVQRELRSRGMVVNHKKVARLMREAGWKAKGAKRFKVTTQSQHRYPVTRWRPICWSDALRSQNLTVCG